MRKQFRYPIVILKFSYHCGYRNDFLLQKYKLWNAIQKLKNTPPTFGRSRRGVNCTWLKITHQCEVNVYIYLISTTKYVITVEKNGAEINNLKR